MNKRLFVLSLLLCCFAVVACGGQKAEQVTAPAMVCPVDSIYTYAAGQLEKSVAQVADSTKFPFFTDLETGAWQSKDSSWWASGFFAGSLWLTFEQTQDPRFKTWAERWTLTLEKESKRKGDADIGYRIINSYLNAYRITGDEKYKQPVLDAAATLASSYNKTVGVVKAYEGTPWKLPVLIDHMMNIELLWWGAANGGDPAWKDMAISHSRKTIEACIREDGSSIQVVDFDPKTGAKIADATMCGLSGESAWARGQGEGIYGFAIAYRETQDPAFLDAAKKLADYFIANLPADFVPYWDFKDPAIPNAIRDASAASMTADGLLEMVALMPTGPDQEKYWKAAENILGSLYKNYMTTGTNNLAIITHASFQGPTAQGADTGLVFGDYNFLSALKKYKTLFPTMSAAPAAPAAE